MLQKKNTLIKKEVTGFIMPAHLGLLCGAGISHPRSAPLLHFQPTLLLRWGEFTASLPHFLPHLPVLLWPPLQRLPALTSCPLVRRTGQSVPPQWPVPQPDTAHTCRRGGWPFVFLGLHSDFYVLAATSLKCPRRLEPLQQFKKKKKVKNGILHLILLGLTSTPVGPVCFPFQLVPLLIGDYFVLFLFFTGSSERKVAFKDSIKYSLAIVGIKIQPSTFPLTYVSRIPTSLFMSANMLFVLLKWR